MRSKGKRIGKLTEGREEKRPVHGRRFLEQRRS